MFVAARKEQMRIGELAGRAGVTLRTVRYYESLGLLAARLHEERGQRYYGEETVLRLRKIEQLKRLGLSLDEIRDVIDLYFTDMSGVRAKVKILAMLRAHLADTEEKLVELQQFRGDLKGHIERFELWLQAHAK